MSTSPKTDPLALDEAPLPLGPALPPLPPAAALLPGAATPATAASGAFGAADLERLCTFAIELWRMKTRLARALPLLPAKEGRPFETSVAKLEELLGEWGLSVEDPSGRPYVEGERLEVLLFEPHADLQRPTILQTVKPAVYRHGVLAKQAQVIVGTPQEGEKAP
jgi:hypothetical protein